MTRPQLNRLIEKYLDGTATNEERRLVDDWYAGFNDREVRLPASHPDEKERLKARIWSKIELQFSESEPLNEQSAPLPGRAGRVIGFPAMLRWAAAIVLVAGVGIAVWLNRSKGSLGAQAAMVEKTTPKGERQQVTLPDGSVVWLNADSKLRYSAEFQGPVREVFLTGEAFFQVAHNPARPFRVRTEKLTTQVLGTSFNVRAYAELPAGVAVATGKVLVEPARTDPRSSHPQRVFLVRNEGVTLDTSRGQLYKTTVKDGLDYAAWRDGTLVFDQTPMREVVQVLNRKYNVSIRIDNPAVYNCLLFGKYKDQPLPNLLGIICSLTRTNYQMHGSQVNIQGQGCSSQ